MDYGYENEVLFPIPMHVAANFNPSGPNVTLAARVNWLVCREVCIPGKPSSRSNVPRWPKLRLPTLENAADAQLLEEFKDTLPQPLPAANAARFRPSGKGFELPYDRAPGEIRGVLSL